MNAHRRRVIAATERHLARQAPAGLARDFARLDPAVGPGRDACDHDEAPAARLASEPATGDREGQAPLLPAPGPRPRRVCPWHLLDLVEDAEGELHCPVGRGHDPRAWLVVDARDRCLGAGWAGEAEPGAVLLDAPLPLTEYLTAVWLNLRWSRKTFGSGAAESRIPAARRRAIVRRKSALNRDTAPSASAA